MTNMERQTVLEQEMLTSGAERFRSQLAKAKASKTDSTLGGGFRLLQRAIEPLALAVGEWLAEANGGKAGARQIAATLVGNLDPFVVAFITARRVLDCISQTHRSLQKTALEVAAGIEDEVRFQAFEEVDKVGFDRTMKHLEKTGHQRHRRSVMVYASGKGGLTWADWPATSKLHLGTKLIELMVDATGLIELTRHAHSSYKVVATAGVLSWLEEANARHALLSPCLLPCVVAPKPWTTPFSGGYHTNSIRRQPLVKTSNHGYLEELASIEMPLVYRTVNALQSTPWKINAPVLEVAKALWDGGQGAGVVLPSRDGVELPKKPAWLTQKMVKGTMTEAQKQEFIAWKRSATLAHTDNAKQISRRIQAARLLSMADRFAPEAAIWFPHSLDFRGRVYSMVPFLSPQGNDLSRGMLTFAQGKPISDGVSAGWLAIHGANVFGADKVGFDDRITWVEENEDVILRIANDPLEERFWWDADKPWQFLSFCFEWAAFQAEGFGYVSHLPVSLDGSCNGIQHFSAMMLDEEGGAAVNLVPNAKPADIYQRVADVVTAKLGEEKLENWAAAQLWLTFGITRKITKRPVMVLPYGGTFLSCRDYVQEAVLEAIAEGTQNPWADDFQAFGKAVQFLAVTVWAAIGEVVIGAKSVMAWLRSVTRVAAKQDLPLNWTTPSGFPCQQAYKEVKERRVKTRLNDSVIYMTLVADTTKLDARRQVSGISPNFVHSLDAAALCTSVDLALLNGVSSFAMVHDSYATHAGDTDLLAACLRQAFVSMYQDNAVLAQFKASVEELVPVEELASLPVLPPPGSLDLSQVLESDYFFA